MSEMEPEFEAISAVTVFTADMAAAVAFYRKLGFEMHYGGADATFTSFHVGSGYLNLMAGRPPEALWGRTIIHVSDVDAMYRRAVHAGLQPEAEPADAFWGERYFHIQDPDGNELSFARPLTG
ncbi:VOC family protein [Aquisalimonas sp.]|uniref:VOC family protein n=1 Tax=unclassified Aquisalimonas TaxID=2644645 RepID=UPI0025B9BE99|nr:VOC family protein [Aquisalimonas sp.]